MQEYRLSISGAEVSFKAEASPEDVEQARVLLENQAERLKGSGGVQSREKLLALLAFGAAYDLLQLQRRLKAVEQRLAGLVKHIGTSR